MPIGCFGHLSRGARSRAAVVVATTLLAALALAACGEDPEPCTDASCRPRDGGRSDATMDGARPGDGGGGTACTRTSDCGPMRVCAMGACVPDLGPCMSHDDCQNDSYCVPEINRCAPYMPGGSDPACQRDIRAGVFAPSVQCRFDQAPAGDAHPNHLHVLSTPMVVDFRIGRGADDPPRPSIVAVFDDGEDGGSENPTGLIRILDGRTCALQFNLDMQMVSHSSPVAIADLDNAPDRTPEIVAFKAGGGLVAFKFMHSGTGGRWQVWWRSTGTDGMTAFNPTGGGWAGPTIADVDDDGAPEVLRHGMVFNGQTGALVGGMSQLMSEQMTSAGLFSVVQDVDEDGLAELVTGTGVYAWNPAMRDWVPEPYSMRAGCAGDGCGNGHVAIADLGPYPTMLPGGGATPEIAVVSAGTVRIDTIEGRTVFGPVMIPGGGTGGPPTVADFDGDGLREVAVAGATAYSVYDPDCQATPRMGGRCASMSTNGVLWSSPAQDASSNVTGSTSFDFEGDGRVEAVYADECFARVYDGTTGTVLFSQHHSSCTWYENPIVADVDGDFRAEIVVGSNFNCGDASSGRACPGVGPRNTDVQFAGIRCGTNADCPAGQCDMGFCRCTTDAQCCPAGATECTYVCAAPPAGTPGAGNTCRASRPQGVRGIRVYNDVADRWVRSRMVWNQHAYNVTNVADDLGVPRTRLVPRNWRDATLNNFRTNVQGVAARGASPDATTAASRVECLPAGGARLIARVCNRGSADMPDGLAIAFYQGDPAMPGTQVCRGRTTRALRPGECGEASCDWAMVPTAMPVSLRIVVDDARETFECREGNNLGTIDNVVCRPVG